MFANHHFNSALRDYNESIRLNPICASTFNNRGSLLFSQVRKKLHLIALILTLIQGNFEAALQDYTAAITLEPNNKNRAHTYLYLIAALEICLTVPRYLNRGILSLLAGQNDRAQEDISKALSLDPNVYTLVTQYFSVRLDRNPHGILTLKQRNNIFFILFRYVCGYDEGNGCTLARRASSCHE